MDYDRLQPIFQSNQAGLLICDMQNDYLKPPHGDFDHLGSIVGPIAGLAAEARARGLPVAYTRRVYRADGLHASPVHKLKDFALARKTLDGTWGAQVVEELEPRPGDVVVDKIRYSAFFQTPLETILRGLGVRFLFLTGVSTHWGVEASARDAEQRDFIPIVVSDATCSVDASLQLASLRNISLFIGFVVSAPQALRLLAQG